MLAEACVVITTIIIDIILIWILMNDELLYYERVSIYFLFIVHFLLFIFYFINYSDGLDILHIIYSLFMPLGLLYESVAMLGLLAIILIWNLIIWALFIKCPMGKFDACNDFIKETSSLFSKTEYVILLLILYFTKIALKIKKIL
jgi:hypothetical protein